MGYRSRVKKKTQREEDLESRETGYKYTMIWECTVIPFN